MKYLKQFEAVNLQTLRDQKNKDWEEIEFIKKSTIDKMDPDPIDVWYIVDDNMVELIDKYGKFTDKYDRHVSVVEFDDIDVCVNFKPSSNYVLYHISYHSWKGGNKIESNDPILNMSYYGDYDYEFFRYYRKLKDKKLKAFYSILVGFNTYYIKGESEDDHSNIEQYCKDMSDTLLKMIKRLKKYPKVEIINVEEFDGSSIWNKKPPTIDSLKNIKYPRISINFSVNSK